MPPSPASPHLITNVATTDATLTDVEMPEPIHTGLEGRNLLPDEHIVDAGYTTCAELMISTQSEFSITLLGPLRIDNSPQARTSSGFARAAFTIDWDNHRVTCPQGVTNTIWSTCTERGRESIVVRFPAPTPQTCPVRTQCTSSTRPAPVANSCSDPARSTRYSSRPAPHKPPRSGNSGTRSGLVSKARSIKPPPPQAFAAAATLACPKRT
jgi:hypothetical protein